MIKYLVMRGRAKITPVKVEKETEKSVWVERFYISGDTKYIRNSKRSAYDNYFDTFEEARKFLLEETEFDIRILKGKIANKRLFLDSIAGLEE